MDRTDEEQVCKKYKMVVFTALTYTKNKLPSLLNSGFNSEEDLKIRIWKTTLKDLRCFCKYFFYLG